MVVPVYIPGDDVPDELGYFADAVRILELCLASLALTSGAETRVTVVANGCRAEVVDVLSARQRAGSIDQLVVSHDNLARSTGSSSAPGARGSRSWSCPMPTSCGDRAGPGP